MKSAIYSEKEYMKKKQKISDFHINKYILYNLFV